MNATFSVTGMTCVNCVSNVEKAVKNVNGIKEVKINLTEEIMFVSYDEKQTDDEEIIRAVKKAGYNAVSSEKIGKEGSKSRELIKTVVSAVLSCLLMAVAMIPMKALAVKCFIQPVILIPIFILNGHFFVNALKALRMKRANMDVLVSLGALCSVFYSVFGVVMTVKNLSAGNSEAAKQFAGNLYFDSAGMILTLVSVGKYLETRSRKKTKDAIGGLLQLIPPKIIRIGTDSEGKRIEEKVSPGDLRVNDLIKISGGETVSADGIVTEGELFVDESSVTGESVLIRKGVSDEVISATFVKKGEAVIELKAVGEDSTLMKIVKMTREAGASKANISRIADRVAEVFVPVIVILAVITFTVWYFIGKDLNSAFSCGISVLVISCPCALGLATPLALTVGMGIAAKKGILFKSAKSLERLNGIDTVVFDKTGTITDGRVTEDGDVLEDSVRETSALAISILNRKGYKTIMLTGDKSDKAERIAKETGVSEVRSELRPENKAEAVAELTKKGHRVLMVGDGINDAPAMASAEVGMAMGAGKDIAIDSADVVLMHSDLLDVVRALCVGKYTIRNVKENLFWAFFYNILMIPLAAGVLYIPFGVRLNPMIGAACMSLSSLCVCLNAMRLINLNTEKDMDNLKNNREKCMVTFAVEGMMCEHCKARVENVLKEIDGVTGAVADLEKKCVEVETEKEISVEVLKNAVKEAGYKVD